MSAAAKAAAALGITIAGIIAVAVVELVVL
jgi:hypothetical protein